MNGGFIFQLCICRVSLGTEVTAAPREFTGLYERSNMRTGGSILPWADARRRIDEHNK
jgi:hypothetical protein